MCSEGLVCELWTNPGGSTVELWPMWWNQVNTPVMPVSRQQDHLLCCSANSACAQKLHQLCLKGWLVSVSRRYTKVGNPLAKSMYHSFSSAINNRNNFWPASKPVYTYKEIRTTLRCWNQISVYMIKTYIGPVECC